jgi:HK97 family phage prohead protease
VNLEHHSFSLRIKGVDESGKFTGVGATYGNVDLGGDRIMPGAFTRTLAGSKVLPLLWQHQPDNPIGSVKVTDSSQGLQVEGQLELADPTGQKAYRFLKSGIIRGLSIGYEAVKSAFVDDVRELTELKLWELSVVTFPMNTSAVVTGIKAMSDDERGKHFKAIDAHRKSIDRAQRGIREHLKSLFDGFDDDDESDIVDDPALLDENDDGEMGMLLSELKSLAAAAEELTEA